MNRQTLGREESFEILSDYSDSPNEVSSSERKWSPGGIAEVIKLSFSIVPVMTDFFYPLCSSHFNINLTLVFSMTPNNNIWVTLWVLKICRQRIILILKLLTTKDNEYKVITCKGHTLFLGIVLVKG